MVQSTAEEALSRNEFCNRVSARIATRILPETATAKPDEAHRLVARQYALSFAADYYNQHSSELLAIDGDEKEIAAAISAFVDTAADEISPLVVAQLEEFSKTRD